MLLCASANLALAQDSLKVPEPEIDVVLCDQTEDPGVLDKGCGQVEAGVLYNTYRSLPESMIGQLMLRFGLSGNCELRMLAEDGKGRDRYMEETVQSVAPLALGAKLVLVDDHPWLPDLSLLGYLKLPFTSRSREQTAYWSPMLLLAFQHGKDDSKWKLCYNIGLQQEVYGKDWAGLGNLSVHYSVSDRLETFAEYFAQFQQGELPQHNLCGGFSCQLCKTIAVYLSGGSTVYYEHSNRFLTAGIAALLR